MIKNVNTNRWGKEITIGPHYKEHCYMCGVMIVCGVCGNNTCNAGYGEVNGEECPACPSAYDLFYKLDEDGDY